ncbi:MAG: EI24 domain-containing protein [Pseudomonadota bacterium]
MIVADYFRAIGQIGDSRFLRVLALGVGLTIALLFAFTVLFAWTVGLIVPDSFSVPWIGEITWIDNVASLAVIPVMIGASVFLMVPVASAFTALFLDSVADAVEERHYPGLAPVAHIPFSENILESLKFLGVLIAVNLMALVLYLIFPPFAPLIFWGVNGLLLGREYATMVARRRMQPEQVRSFRKRHAATIWVAGVLMAIPLTIPIMNLVMPIIGVAAFTHLFHRLAERA